MKSHSFRILPLLAAFLLLTACGSPAQPTTDLPEPQPAGGAPTLSAAARPSSRQQLEDQRRQLEDEGWTPIDGQVCAHGGYMEYTDTQFSRAGAEGEETMWFCFYRSCQLEPDQAFTSVSPWKSAR